jgi:thioester reductase-like protein
MLARVWEAVLRLEEGEVRPEDDFFDLGGHSLAAAQLSSRVEDGFGVHVSMPMFMEDPTLVGLCDRIEALQRGESSSAETQHPPDLRDEAVLDPDIVPEFAARGAHTPGEARGAFLTGATGFLGAFLLQELLSTTEATVHCLVRPRGDAPPMEAVETNLRGYGIWRPEWAERIVPVAGDLGEPLFGMDEEGFDALAREVEVVVHAGAVVNLVYPYSALKAANVGGTREVLRLACRHGAKPVHHVSTNGAFPPGTGLCEEDADLDALAEGIEDGYSQSKWVAEGLVRQAAGRGLPVSVYRPGNVSGHSETGASNPRDLLGAVLVESLRLGRAPEVEGWSMEMTPVDFVAGAILHLASDPRTLGGTYHLASPAPPPAGEVFDRLEEIGYPLERIPYDEWLDAVNAAPRGEDDPVGDVLRGTAPAAEQLRDGNTYDDRNARRALRGGPRRPAIDAALLATYARYFAERGLVRAPASLHETGRRG